MLAMAKAVLSCLALAGASVDRTNPTEHHGDQFRPYMRGAMTSRSIDPAKGALRSRTRQ
jgi:hypothetical protein